LEQSTVIGKKKKTMSSTNHPDEPAIVAVDENNLEGDVESSSSSSNPTAEDENRPPQKRTKETQEDHPLLRRSLYKVIAFYLANDFPLNVLIAIGLAKAYPPLGAEYLKPKITGMYRNEDVPPS
jgi:hypothetical protein